MLPNNMPAEWEPQDWLWIGFPYLREEWLEYLEPAQRQIAAFANAVADSGQKVRLIVRDDINCVRARELISEEVSIEKRRYGDIWLRDTGPLILRNGRALCHKFNGWGGKYPMDGDNDIGQELASDAGLEILNKSWILEGGAIDSDGTGTVLTTEQCLLNPNRNPNLTKEKIEKNLAQDFGFKNVVWLGKGLENDHTDGHVDNLVRFVSTGQVVLPVPTTKDDPNIEIYADAKRRLRAVGLEIHEIPSPGLVERNGKIEPASYVNFAITTYLVVVPTFGKPTDAEGVEAIAALFPDRKTIGLPADAVLAGGGGFHCASQQMPLLNFGQSS